MGMRMKLSSFGYVVLGALSLGLATQDLNILAFQSIRQPISAGKEQLPPADSVLKSIEPPKTDNLELLIKKAEPQRKLGETRTSKA